MEGSDVKILPSQQQQHRPQQPQRQQGVRRGLLRVALEASPLQQAQIPSCSLRSIAIVNREKEEPEDRLLLYLGTDSGHLLLYTWFRSPSPSPSKPPVAAEFSSSALFLSASVSLSKSPVECLCPLPRSGAIAALLDKQVVVLDLHSLDTLDLLTFSKGSVSITRAFGCTINSLLFPAKGRDPSSVAGALGEALSPVDTPRKSSQLSRLFGSAKLSAKRGSWNLLNGESGSIPSPSGGEQLNAKLGAFTINKSNAGSQGSESSIQEPSNRKFSGIERFAVATKQKLVLYEVRIASRGKKANTITVDNGAVALKIKEINGPEDVVTMAWIGNSIIIGNFQEYRIFSVIDGQSSCLFSLPVDLVSPPLLKPFPKDVEALLLMDTVGVVLNAKGQPTSSSLVFHDVPDAIGQSLTYVIVVKRGLVELYHRKTGAKVQSVMLSDTATGPHLVTDDDDGKYIAVSSAVKVYCLERVPVDEQLKELLRQRQFDEAVGLAEECAAEMEVENAREKLAIVHAQAGFLLFFDLNFKDAVDHFLESHVMHPAEIFPFFPTLTERWRSMVPRNRYWGLHPPPQALENVIQIKLQAVQRGLVLQAVSDFSERQTGHGFLATSSRSKSAMVEDYTMQATEHVIRYLKIARNKVMTTSMKEGVDTLLMKLLIKVGAIGDMEGFAALQNSCLVEEVEELLQDSQKLRTLAFLYETKSMLASALQVWQTLAQGHPNMGIAGTRAHREIHEVPLSETDPMYASRLAAAHEASRLLESSSDEVLVLMHLKWILKVSQELAFQILSSPKRAKALSPDDVLHGLGSSEKNVQQRYLQWLVQDQGVEEPRYHTLLALSLARSAMESLSTQITRAKVTDEPVVSKSSDRSHDIKSGSVTEEFKNVCNGFDTNSLAGVVVGMHPSPERADAVPTDCSIQTSSIPANDVRCKLQEFLESSNNYDPSTVLAVIQGSDLWREQAIVYRKLGDELSVFQILALKLGDTEAAEQYCAELDRPDAYMRLLDLYLKPGDGREPMYNAAVHLLQVHGTCLDPLQVLAALPSNVPVQLAYETIARMFRSRAHLHREGQIVRHLSRAENFEARLLRLAERARYVRITDQTSCGSCFSRFGTKLFALYPNGSAVCYKCFRNSGSSIDPVSGHDFKKDPMRAEI